MADGFDQAPRKIIKQVTTGDDDRAVLILNRTEVSTATVSSDPVTPARGRVEPPMA